MIGMRLQVENLHLDRPSRAGPISVLSDVAFQLHAGEMVGLVGESGCGKSVTLMNILGLNPLRNSTVSGSIKLDGQELLGLDRRRMHDIRGRDVAMIFQDAGSALDPHMTIGEQIGEVFAIHRPDLGAAKRRIKVIDLLREVHIPDPEERMNYYPHQFSGGMQQRAVIAIALALRPKLLLADEPTTALDVTIQAQIMTLLSQINAQHRCSVLLVTHDIALAATMCSRILVMYGGQIVEEGPVDLVINQPSHPYTKGLLRCVPDMRQRRNVQPIPGEVPRHQLKSAIGCRFANRCALVQDVCRVRDVILSRVSRTHRARCILAGGASEI